MRETDLLAFEIAVTEGQPAMVMCSYNKVNGDWACENSYLLTDVLKKAWGFQGFVMSDWGGTHSTAKAVLAGLDNEEPGSRYLGDALKKKVETGAVPMARLDDMVHRIVRTEFALGVVDNPPLGRVVDPFAGADTAQRIAEQASVLLKNSGGQLPLNAAALKSVALIGSHADTSVLSGGGSAQVDPPGGGPSRFGGPDVWFPSSPLKAIRAKAPKARVVFDQGSDPAAAAAAAKAADVAIVFVNQPTSEGRDLASLTLPGNQDRLVSAVAAANPHTIVVLETGGPAAMPWIGQVGAAIEVWYPGIRGGRSLGQHLVRRCQSLRQTARYLRQDRRGSAPPGRPRHGSAPSARRRPRPNAGFRHRLHRRPEGRLQMVRRRRQGALVPVRLWTLLHHFRVLRSGGHHDGVSVTVRNTGKREGAEIVQVYVGLPPAANEPPKRLVAWEKVRLAPGEQKTVSLTLDPKFLSIFNDQTDAWELLPGDYKFFVGGSSRNTPLTALVKKAL